MLRFVLGEEMFWKAINHYVNKFQWQNVDTARLIDAIEEATGFFKQFAAVLNDHLLGQKYLLGDRLTVADFAVAVTLPYAEEAKIPVAGFAEIERWYARLEQLPAWRQLFPPRPAVA